MTERFSPEYKAFILSDEASVLQERWKKRGVCRGDWVWDAGTKIGKVRLVTSTETHTWSLDFLLDGVARRWTAEVDWLPTLADLLGMIEARWPLVDIDTYPQGEWLDDSTAHIMAAAECVDWCPTGGQFWRCNECGDTLHRQPDGGQTYGSFPEPLDDKVWDTWNGGGDLPICPHCGEARAKGLILAAAKLAVRVLEEGKE